MTRFMGALALSLLAGCGSGPTEPPPPPPPPAAPAANITATGGGVLVLHPSIDPRYVVALEAPIRIIETAGGSANWDYARMSLMLGGREIERTEMGSGALASAGYGSIALNSNQVYRAIFRFNAEDFDDVVITLGFTDRKDGRTFTVPIDLESFTGVDIDFNALTLPRSRIPL